MKGDAQPGCASEECQDALEQLEAFLDGELPGTRQEDVEAHLQACYPCTDRASFEERLRDIVRSRCVEEPPQRLVSRIRQHLDAAIGAEGA